MHLIRCPHCGHRDESEFVYGGPFSGARPDDPGAIQDEAWSNYLTVPDNPVGPVVECWWHANGCGAWVTIARDTATHDIREARDDRG